MADASESMSNNSVLSTDKTVSSKPTNLDEQRNNGLQVDIKGDSTTSASTTHEDATPVEKHSLKEGLPIDNVSASELTMSSIPNETVTVDRENEKGPTQLPSEDVASKNGVISGGGGSNLHDSDSGVSLTSSHSKPKVSHEWIDVLGNGNLLKRVSYIYTYLDSIQL